MKFPMVPESTMAVILIVSANVIGTVRCLTSWYGVIAETTTVFSCDKSELHEEAKSEIFLSAGATGSVGQSSFLALKMLEWNPKGSQRWLAPPL
jgi:hypothetical protein